MRRSSRKRTLVMAVLAALTLVAAGCSHSGTGGQASSGPVTVGVILPLSGPNAELGQPIMNGMEAARKLVNKEGGIGGRPVQFARVDASSEEAARAGAERLLNQGVRVVMGTYASTLALAAAPVIVRGGGVYVEEGAASSTLTSEGLDRILRINPTAQMSAREALTFTAHALSKATGVAVSKITVGWVGPDDDFARDYARGLANTAQQLGMKLVLSLQYPITATNLDGVAAQVKAANPDILGMGAFVDDGVILGRALRDAKVAAKVIFGGSGGTAGASWVNALGSDANGTFNVGFVPAFNAAGLPAATRQRLAAFNTAYKQQTGTEPNGYARAGFDAAWVLLDQIMRAHNTTDPARIRQVGGSLNLPAGTLLNGWGVKFDEHGQNTRAFYQIGQWQKGVQNAVSPATIAMTQPTMIPLPPWGHRNG